MDTILYKRTYILYKMFKKIVYLMGENGYFGYRQTNLKSLKYLSHSKIK